VKAIRFSDHRPVIASYVFREDQEKIASQTLQHRVPYGVDGSLVWKRYIGILLDKIVGSIWYLVHFAGLGDDRLGLALLVVSISTLLLGKAVGINIQSIMNYIGRWSVSN